MYDFFSYSPFSFILSCFGSVDSTSQITSGNHAIGTVRKFPTLPLNANGVWIDPAGGVWRQATAVATNKEPIPDYAQVSAAPTLPLPDYER